MSKIYLELRSGLGNQLFQFAFGYALSIEFGKELILCPAYFDPQWKYWLKKLLGREARSFRLPLILDRYQHMRIESIRQLIKNPSFLILDESKATVDSIRSECAQNKDIYLKGYWQDPRLFLSYTDQLANLFAPSFPVSEKFKTTLQQFDDNTVGIHFRRGDFLTNRAFGACSLEYYQAAIRAIGKLVSAPSFLIFTNNRKWVELNFPADVPYQIYSNALNDHSDLEEMLLMSKLRSMIISNSTFSWWGAYLNSNQRKHIVCPEKWFLSNKLQENARHLILDNWIRLPNELELTN